MLKHYLKIALRTMSRKKGYSFINISGLAVGMACCLAIFQFVAFEYSFDRFHENKQDIYSVIMAGSWAGEEMGPGAAFTPQALGPVLEEEIPEIQRFSRLHPDSPVVSTPSDAQRVFEEDDVFYVDPGFMEMFTFPFAQGSPRETLEPGTVFISESAAKKYFGNEDPVGQVLDVTGATDRSYTVAAVFEDVPANSQLQFSMLLPMENILREGQYNEEPEGGWSWNNFVTYIQLYPDVESEVIDQKMTDILMAQRGDVLRERGFTQRLYAQPLLDIYLNDQVEMFVGKTGSYRTVYFFIIIAIVTLLIAMVNYVNLATARALDRAREVGVRKVIGAERRQLITQFFFESALTNLIAFVFAVALVELLQPVITNLWESQATDTLWLNPWLVGAFFATFLVSTLLAGLYPALVLSSFKPVSVLKGKAGSFVSQLWLRRGLVVLQFSAAVILIGGTGVVYNQLNYMKNMELGLDLEQVITLPGPRVVPEETDLATAQATLTEELQRLPGVRQVATSWSLPGQGFNWNGGSLWRAENSEDSAIRSVATYVDSSFVSLYDLEIIAGKEFDETTAPFASASPSEIIVNETAVRTLGFASPEEALNHPLMMGSGEPYQVEIVGVLKDFNWSSAHSERENIIFGYTEAGGYISVRAAERDLPGTIAAIQSIYTDMFPGNVFSYAFADETFGKQYQDDQRFAILFALFAGFAIAIACLGLFGLASFTAQQRTKEIGVRKVLGASVASLFALLSRDFLKLVAFAIVIALPLAYYLMQRWLEGFAYRIDISMGLLFLVTLLILLIAFVSVAYQSIQAAMMDPVDSLRTE